ncbi:hypothetical protein NUU61_008957 [Penicillium alfredii]|uniref:DUF647 domain-containing protein n=1 Tax=Penicillium alfredii TaxID=1506179 RepID=A0A9W9EM51_9EURO|nr:uncharacterized protein NUU61_008957 [Penicillium alfredii]KAJ5084378.1 hypothetical protein NUU61_008957 [Penicillium alfredii]
MASHEKRLALQETDEAGHPTATYIYSRDVAPTSAGRVDVMGSSSASPWSTKPLIDSLSDIFLPSGYPQSVSEDYLPYQIFVSIEVLNLSCLHWIDMHPMPEQSSRNRSNAHSPCAVSQDSLQAFCSSIAGLLSSRAVLQGVGVGNASASPTSALLLHILQDTSGRVATIFFAHRVGTALEPECKTYRLAADVFNDIAMILDCVSPMVPGGAMRVSVLSTAGILRALCGVAGGSSKASLSAHFARWGNLAELNAKDSSQETVISLLGMLVGSVVVSHITGFRTTWAALLVLLALHLSMNYAAVRAVQMTSLNRQRANIVFSALLDSDSNLELATLGSSPDPDSDSEHQWKILTPADVAQQERIFHRDAVLEWTQQTPYPKTHRLGTAQIGVPLPTFFQPEPFKQSRSFQTAIPIAQITALFADEAYLLSVTRDSSTASPKWHAAILLKKQCSVRAQLKAWTHALLAARILAESLPTQHASTTKHAASLQESGMVVDVIARSLAFLNQHARFERYVARLAAAGWNVEVAALETRAGRRVSCSEV